MKPNGMLLALALALVTVAASAQTPPPNDNYANRTVLTGTDLTFSGTLTGATVKDAQETETFGSSGKSIWWTWTAPVSTSLTIQYVSQSQGAINGWTPELIVYSATNGATSPNGLILPALSSMYLGTIFQPQTLSIPVTAGSNYQIQIIGQDPVSFTLRLIATNAPSIIKQPVSQTVNSNASVAFYVVYAGTNQAGYSFQWQFNGTDLPDETTPIISLTNINSGMAGAYSVIVSN